MKRFAACISSLLVCVALASYAQQKTAPASSPAKAAPHSHSSSAHPGAAAPAAIRLEGMGRVHHKVTTANPQAQAFFDQGLALVYAFNHDESAKAFRRAAQLDPKLAMAYWGVALTQGSNYNMPSMPEREKAAAEAMKKAVALAPAASPEEQDYIAALNQRYSEDPKADLKQLATAYKDAMFALAKKYPDDLDATTLAAESAMNLRPWALWTLDGQPEEGTLQIISMLESVLLRDPMHTGANHYYIHAVEGGPNAANALPSADRLGRLAPAAGHLVHMPSHIYSRVGEHDAAARVNVEAAAADEAYFKKVKPDGVYAMMYYSHNLHFQAYANSMEGRYADAIAVAKKLEAHAAPHVKDMPMLEGFAAIPLAVEERFGKWDNVLAQPAPPAGQPFHTLFWHFSRGMAYAGKGDVPNAQKEYESLATAEGSIPADQLFVQNKMKVIASIADGVLASSIARAQKKYDDAEAMLKRAVDAQDGLKYIEPPEWFYPVREDLGGLYLTMDRPVDAERVFREDLDRNPRNGRSLFGLMESLKAQKKDREAELVKTQFDAAWKRADVKLTAAGL